MTGKDLLDSMEYVDAHWIELAENPTIENRIRWKPLAAMAACLVLILGIVFFAFRENRTLILSADKIADIFENDDLLGEYDIPPVVVSGAHELPLNPLPDTKTVPLFNRNDKRMGNPTGELLQHQALLPILERMCNSLGIAVPDAHANLYNYLGYWIGGGVGTLGQYDYFFVERPLEVEHKHGQYDLCLDGEQVTIDQSQNDEQIIASLASVQKKLFAIFGENFSDAKVIREYSYHVYGAKSVTIYYYDEAAHPLNEVCSIPITDYIAISFDNEENWTGDPLSADKLINAKISYYHYRLTPKAHYQPIGKGKLISLQTAEELLAKGYSFGWRCQECADAQTDAGCTHYDYVSFGYLEDHDREGINLVLPFYVFYKKTGTEPNGNEIYKKAYVCAIEVTGLEKLFAD